MVINESDQAVQSRLVKVAHEFESSADVGKGLLSESLCCWISKQHYCFRICTSVEPIHVSTCGSSCNLMVRLKGQVLVQLVIRDLP